MITPQEIGENTTYHLPDWKKWYKWELFFIAEAISFGLYRGHFNINVDELLAWYNENEEAALTIVNTNDVALFPPCLQEVKTYYLTHLDMDYCETISGLKNDPVFRKYIPQHEAVYGYKKLDNLVGHSTLKKLRQHLNLTIDEFTEIYGNELCKNPSAVDDLIAETFTNYELIGGKRGFKKEGEL